MKLKQSNPAERRTAIHLLRSGKTMTEVAQELGRSICWVCKWQARYKQDGWTGLHERTRAPKHQPMKLSEPVRQAIRQARSELEAEAARSGNLSYIGAGAIRARLRRTRLKPLPSLSSIERVLRDSGLTRPRQQAQATQIDYPHLCPDQPHQLVQVDICPHYLPGGQAVACFNAIDVVSRYPTGQPFAHKRAQEAVEFLEQVWRELGIPSYTQVDNEGCFSGGFSHPYVLGRVLRLALLVGTELIYSPFYHPESNGTVERFHQEYDRHLWNKLDLPTLGAVRDQSPLFFRSYRHSGHHSALNGCSPAERHWSQPGRNFPDDFVLPTKLPLTVGKVHFMRLVNQAKQIILLNVAWPVPLAQPDQGVWATLELSQPGATLWVYDAAPDAPKRTCLAKHPFPLSEPVVPLLPQFWPPQPQHALPGWQFVRRFLGHSFHDVLKVSSVVKVLSFFTMS